MLARVRGITWLHRYPAEPAPKISSPTGLHATITLFSVEGPQSLDALGKSNVRCVVTYIIWELGKLKAV